MTWSFTASSATCSPTCCAAIGARVDAAAGGSHATTAANATGTANRRYVERTSMKCKSLFERVVEELLTAQGAGRQAVDQASGAEDGDQHHGQRRNRAADQQGAS